MPVTYVPHIFSRAMLSTLTYKESRHMRPTPHLCLINASIGSLVNMSSRKRSGEDIDKEHPKKSRGQPVQENYRDRFRPTLFDEEALAGNKKFYETSHP